MDADRIRQAVELHGCDLSAKYGDEHRREEPECAVCLVDAAALAHADCLDGRDTGSVSQPFNNGPTDEDIRAGGAKLCTPDAHVWNPLPEDFDSPPCISHFIEARALLEAVFQARKERG